MKSLFLLITLGIAVTVGAEASPTYYFSISGPGFSASGDLVTSGTSSPYTIISITNGTLSNYTANQGSSSGSTITGGAITGVSAFEGGTNLVPLGSTGFSFADANGDNYNIHLLFGSTYVLSDSLGTLSETSSSIAFTVTAVPESSTVGLSGLGLLAATLIWRRRAANLKIL